MAEYGEVLDMDDRTKPAQGGWMVDGNTQGAEEAQFPNSFLYMDQVEDSGDFPAADFNPDHLLNPAPSGDWLSGGDPPSYGPQEGGALRHMNSWRGIADYYVDGQGQQVEPLPERYVLPQWVKDLRIGPSQSAGGMKPPGVLLKGLGTPMPPSPRSIRAAAMGITDNRSDVMSQLLAQTWREGGGANEEGLFAGGSEWDPRRTHGAAARVGGVELQGIEKVDKLRGGGEEPGAANSPLPWAAGPYYPASTPGRKILSPTNHSAAERRRRDRINDRFDILRRLIPGTQKADKATVLKAVIEYVTRLQAAGADNLLHKEATDEQSHSLHPQQQTALSEVYTPTMSTRSPGWMSEEEEASSLQDKVAVDVRDQSYVVRITCPTRSGLLFDIVAALKQLGLEVTDGELSSCRGRVLHVLYVPMRHVAKDAIKAKLEAAIFPGRPLAVKSPARLGSHIGAKKETLQSGVRFEGHVPEPVVQLQLPPKTQRRGGVPVTSNKKRKSSGGTQ